MGQTPPLGGGRAKVGSPGGSGIIAQVPEGSAQRCLPLPIKSGPAHREQILAVDEAEEEASPQAAD